MSQHNIQLVIFDLDGTLVDAYAAVASSINYTLAQLGRPPADDQAVKASVGWGIRHLVATFVDEGDVDRALSIYRQHHARALKAGTKWLPGAHDVLKQLKARGIRLAIASNRPSRFTHIILKHLKAAALFEHVLCADNVRKPKPAGEILKQILDKSGLAPEQALYVGDMTVDVETGRAAGVRTVAVTSGSSSRADLARLNPLAVVDDVTRLLDFLP